MIPVKCFTCGNILANKYTYYQIKVREYKDKMKGEIEEVKYLTTINKEKTPEGKILDDIGLNKICCRRHFISHVDIYP